MHALCNCRSLASSTIFDKTLCPLCAAVGSIACSVHHNSHRIALSKCKQYQLHSIIKLYVSFVHLWVRLVSSVFLSFCTPHRHAIYNNFMHPNQGLPPPQELVELNFGHVNTETKVIVGCILYHWVAPLNFRHCLLALK